MPSFDDLWGKVTTGTSTPATAEPSSFDSMWDKVSTAPARKPTGTMRMGGKTVSLEEVAPGTPEAPSDQPNIPAKPTETSIRPAQPIVPQGTQARAGLGPLGRSVVTQTPAASMIGTNAPRPINVPGLVNTIPQKQLPPLPRAPTHPSGGLQSLSEEQPMPWEPGGAYHPDGSGGQDHVAGDTFRNMGHEIAGGVPAEVIKGAGAEAISGLAGAGKWLYDLARKHSLPSDDMQKRDQLHQALKDTYNNFQGELSSYTKTAADDTAKQYSQIVKDGSLPLATIYDIGNSMLDMGTKMAVAGVGMGEEKEAATTFKELVKQNIKSGMSFAARIAATTPGTAADRAKAGGGAALFSIAGGLAGAKYGRFAGVAANMLVGEVALGGAVQALKKAKNLAANQGEDWDSLPDTKKWMYWTSSAAPGLIQEAGFGLMGGKQKFAPKEEQVSAKPTPAAKAGLEQPSTMPAKAPAETPIKPPAPAPEPQPAPAVASVPKGNVNAETGHPGYIATVDAVAFAKKRVGTAEFKKRVESTSDGLSPDAMVKGMRIEKVARDIVEESQKAAPAVEAEKGGEKAPELMTPEENGITPSEPAVYPPSSEKKFFGAAGMAGAKPEHVAYWKAKQKEYRDAHRRAKDRTEKSNALWNAVEAARKKNKPINAESFEWRYPSGKTEGYTREGDRYVYKPSSATPATQEARAALPETGETKAATSSEQPAAERKANEARTETGIARPDEGGAAKGQDQGAKRKLQRESRNDKLLERIRNRASENAYGDRSEAARTISTGYSHPRDILPEVEKLGKKLKTKGWALVVVDHPEHHMGGLTLPEEKTILLTDQSAGKHEEFHAKVVMGEKDAIQRRADAFELRREKDFQAYKAVLEALWKRFDPNAKASDMEVAEEIADLFPEAKGKAPTLQRIRSRMDEAQIDADRLDAEYSRAAEETGYDSERTKEARDISERADNRLERLTTLAKKIEGEQLHALKAEVTPGEGKPAPSPSAVAAEDATEYRGQHQPNPDGPPAHNLLSTDLAPRDIYEHPEFYTGEPNSKASKESIAALRKIRAKPNATITVYRASPKDVLNRGDWISLSRDYSLRHGMADNPSEDVPVHAFKVKAKDVRWAGDTLEEFGYFPAVAAQAEAVEATEAKETESGWTEQQRKDATHEQLITELRKPTTGKISHLRPERVSELVAQAGSDFDRIRKKIDSGGYGENNEDLDDFFFGAKVRESEYKKPEQAAFIEAQKKRGYSVLFIDKLMGNIDGFSIEEDKIVVVRKDDAKQHEEFHVRDQSGDPLAKELISRVNMDSPVAITYSRKLKDVDFLEQSLEADRTDLAADIYAGDNRYGLDLKKALRGETERGTAEAVEATEAKETESGWTEQQRKDATHEQLITELRRIGRTPNPEKIVDRAAWVNNLPLRAREAIKRVNDRCNKGGYGDQSEELSKVVGRFRELPETFSVSKFHEYIERQEGRGYTVAFVSDPQHEVDGLTLEADRVVFISVADAMDHEEFHVLDQTEQPLTKELISRVDMETDAAKEYLDDIVDNEHQQKVAIPTDIAADIYAGHNPYMIDLKKALRGETERGTAMYQWKDKLKNFFTKGKVEGNERRTEGKEEVVSPGRSDDGGGLGEWAKIVSSSERGWRGQFDDYRREVSRLRKGTTEKDDPSSLKGIEYDPRIARSKAFEEIAGWFAGRGVTAIPVSGNTIARVHGDIAIIPFQNGEQWARKSGLHEMSHVLLQQGSQTVSDQIDLIDRTSADYRWMDDLLHDAAHEGILLRQAKESLGYSQEKTLSKTEMGRVVTRMQQIVDDEFVAYYNQGTSTDNGFSDISTAERLREQFNEEIKRPAGQGKVGYREQRIRNMERGTAKYSRIPEGERTEGIEGKEGQHESELRNGQTRESLLSEDRRKGKLAAIQQACRKRVKGGLLKGTLEREAERITYGGAGGTGQALRSLGQKAADIARMVIPVKGLKETHGFYLEAEKAIIISSELSEADTLAIGKHELFHAQRDAGIPEAIELRGLVDPDSQSFADTMDATPNEDISQWSRAAESRGLDKGDYLLQQIAEEVCANRMAGKHDNEIFTDPKRAQELVDILNGSSENEEAIPDNLFSGQGKQHGLGRKESSLSQQQGEVDKNGIKYARSDALANMFKKGQVQDEWTKEADSERTEVERGRIADNIQRWKKTLPRLWPTARVGGRRPLLDATVCQTDAFQRAAERIKDNLGYDAFPVVHSPNYGKMDSALKAIGVSSADTTEIPYLLRHETFHAAKAEGRQEALSLSDLVDEDSSEFKAYMNRIKTEAPEQYADSVTASKTFPPELREQFLAEWWRDEYAATAVGGREANGFTDNEKALKLVQSIRDMTNVSYSKEKAWGETERGTAKTDEVTYGNDGSVKRTPASSPAPDTATVPEVQKQLLPGYAKPSLRQQWTSLLLPGMASKEHLEAARSLGAALGTMHRLQEAANHQLRRLSRSFIKAGVLREDKPLAENEGVKFMSDISQGREQTGWKKEAANTIDRLFKDRIDRLEKAGVPLEHVRENYFPGIWTQKSRQAFNMAMDEAAEAGKAPKGDLASWTKEQRAGVKSRVDEILEQAKKLNGKEELAFFAKRPLKGKESFRKQKVFDDIMDGAEFGLRPISQNPIDLAKLKLAEMDRSIMANTFLQEQKAKGEIQVISPYEKPPEGWFKINDKYGTIYGPPTVEEREYVDRAIYDGLMDAAKRIGINPERVFRAGRGKLGYASTHGKTVTQFGSELSVLAHEIGHQLDFKYGLWDEITGGEHPSARSPVQKELRALADLSWEGSEPSKYYKAKVRKQAEKMAHMLEAYVHAPEKFKEVAPTVFKTFDSFLKSHDELRGISEIKPGIALKELKNERYVGLPILGYRIARKPVADIMNNYLSSSLYNTGLTGKAYSGYMFTASALNQAQLGGGSMYHAGFTSIDVQTSAGAQVLKDIYGVFRGSRKIGQLGETLAKFPQAMIRTQIVGSKALNAWRNPNAPMNPRMEQVAKAAELAGAGFKMEHGLQTSEIEKQFRDWYSGHRIRAAMRTPVALTEYLAAPIMRYLVPRQKAGVFSELAWRIIEQNPGKTLEELRPQFREAWNRVDARLGQVRYDRLFINNIAKNVVQAGVRAPGWTGGTIAEIGGSFKDAATWFKEWHDTGKPPKEMPDRIAYTISLMVGMAAVNGALTYAFTKKKPEGMDYWAFRDGTYDENGKPNRLLLPSYMKDIIEWTKHPGTTAINKTHPLVSVASDIAHNKDFYGTEIMPQDATIPEKVFDIGKYSLKAFVPFWIRGEEKQREQGAGAQRFGALVGIMPEPKTLTATPAEELAGEISHAKQSTGGRPAETTERMRLKSRIMSELKKGNDTPLLAAQEDGKITSREATALETMAPMKPLERLVYHMEIADVLRVYGKASPEEKKLLDPIIEKKRENYEKPNVHTEEQSQEIEQKMRAKGIEPEASTSSTHYQRAPRAKRSKRRSFSQAEDLTPGGE